MNTNTVEERKPDSTVCVLAQLDIELIFDFYEHTLHTRERSEAAAIGT